MHPYRILTCAVSFRMLILRRDLFLKEEDQEGDNVKYLTGEDTEDFKE